MKILIIIIRVIIITKKVLKVSIGIQVDSKILKWIMNLLIIIIIFKK